jgi:hypothetical protein
MARDGPLAWAGRGFKGLDRAVGAIHRWCNPPLRLQTERSLSPMDYPRVCILGFSSGRWLPFGRDPERVTRAAATRGGVVAVHGHPDWLEWSDVVGPMAWALATLTDAHEATHFEVMRQAGMPAGQGGIGPGRGLNTRCLAGLRKPPRCR